MRDQGMIETEAPDEGEPSRPPAPRRVVPGERIDRYVVLSKLGAGAMGVVLAAYDPKLDRRVALKLLEGRAGSRERLEREARALAKLDHPNVVGVHDVGEHGGQLFIGMDYVAGQTLRAWMDASAEPRPWPEVLRVFSQAGRGLAAAHEAGLIHRDFKPDNAMIGDDGRVRVMDFGLARRDGEGGEGGRGREPVTLDSGGPGELAQLQTLARELDLTRSGAMMGTPAYMAVEQFHGGEVDARSDQFGFCVALYEALYGERPFPGGGLATLLDALERGEIREPPRGSSVPSWLRRAVVRGLAADKQARWPSMRALLDALADDPALRRGRWRGAALTGALGAGLALGVWYAIDQERQVCAGLDAPLTEVWNSARRSELRAAFEATQLSYAAGTWERVEPRLAAYAEAWVGARVEACEASARGEQSGELLDQRMSCLDERLQHLRATVDVLLEPDTDVVLRAVDTVEGLPRLEPCADVAALRARVPLPEDPERARQVEELDAALVALAAARRAGKLEGSPQQLEPLLRRAQALDYEPVLVRAQMMHGELALDGADYELAERELVASYRAALGLQMMDEAASAAADLIYLQGYLLARYEEGQRWALDAEAVARAAKDRQIHGKISNNRGTLELRAGHYQDALELFTRAHAQRAETLGAKHAETLGSITNMGIAAAESGDLGRARQELERALELRTEVLGPDHPKVAGGLQNLAILLIRTEAYEQAAPLLERALDIKERALGAEHPDVGSTLTSLAEVELARGRPEPARAHFERALKIREQAQGAEHPDLFEALEALARLAREQGALAEARAYAERARDVIAGSLEPAAAERGHPHLAEAEHELGEIALAAGQPDAAIAHFERARSIQDQTEIPDPLAQPSTRFGLARALWDAAGEARDPQRALELAALARADFAKLERAEGAKQLARVERWLAARR